jgi:hypothetical protein
MSPWRAYLLFPQDHARWTATYGEMISSDLQGLKAHQMDVVTPSKGRETPEDGTRKEEECFLRDTLAGLDQGGLALPP